jgi:flagellar biosynthesis/type III secretory pathway protein FliH
MTDFCSARIELEGGLRPADGVLRAESFAVTADACKAAARLLASARSEADAIVQAARAEAGRIDDEARERARAATRDAEERTLKRAAELLQALDRTNEEFLGRAQDTVLKLAQALFERLVAGMAPRERVEGALRHLQLQAPRRLVHPLLRVHPEDAESVAGVDWEIVPDLAMPRGSCRLEAQSGEWSFDFDAAVEALSAVIKENGSCQHQE